MKTYRVEGPTPQGPADRSQQMFLLAVDFHESALRSIVEEPDPAGGNVSSPTAMVTAYAFACELYLKALATSPLKTHRLDILYARLPADIRDRVSESYKLRTNRDSAALNSDLREMATAFMEWRYIFERDGLQIHTNLLVALTKSLYEIAKALHPDLSIRAVQDQKFLSGVDEHTMTLINFGGGTFLHVVGEPSLLEK